MCPAASLHSWSHVLLLNCQVVMLKRSVQVFFFICLLELCHWCWGRLVVGHEWVPYLSSIYKYAFSLRQRLRDNVEHYKQSCFSAIRSAIPLAMRRTEQSVLALRMCKIALWIILQKCVRSHQFHSLNTDWRRNYSKV